MNVRIVALLVLTLSVPAGAQKIPPVQGPFASAKGFKCSFPAYGTGRWTNGIPQTATATQEFSFQISSIDLKKREAVIVGSGTALVSTLLTPTGMNVIERTPIGNLNITTIFSAGGQGQAFPAVHSRHLGELDAPPRPSQSYGTCDLVQ